MDFNLSKLWHPSVFSPYINISFRHGLLIPHYIDHDLRNILHFAFSNDYIGKNMFVAWAHKIVIL
jgi:hypothetical protein